MIGAEKLRVRPTAGLAEVRLKAVSEQIVISSGAVSNVAVSNVVILNVVILNVVILNVVILNVVILSGAVSNVAVSNVAVSNVVISNVVSRMIDRRDADRDVFRDGRPSLIRHALDGRRRLIRGEAIGRGVTRERGHPHRRR